ncbi:MAG: hypothetical protein PUA96_06010 [Bacteroidales bacterium]|nr:hypothetical protein [Bacteroidales bacterium]
MRKSLLILFAMISFIACKSDDPDMPVSKDPLTFTASGTVKVGIYNTGKFYEEVSLEYKINDGDWAIYEIDQDITLNDGDRLSFQSGKDGNKCMGTPDYTYLQFKAEGGKIAASGNIMSLLDRTMKQTAITGPLCFFRFFSGCGNLTSAPELPATALSESCYLEMFFRCESLEEAPKLPARKLAKRCYDSMFCFCTSLITAPELPATTLAPGCYYRMFSLCKSLTATSELPAKKMAENCYEKMFEECYFLESAPELPATTLAPGCYRYMFKYCSVTTAPKLPAKVLEESCYEGMFYDCNLTTAPELPAKTLVKNCYAEMFFSNIHLNHITMLAEDISADNCLNRWVSKVNSSGTFIKCTSAKWDVSGENGIPEGWEVQYK